MKDHEIVYTKCEDEVKLLLNFLDFWSYEKNTPDVVTGWNTRLFDIPYLANRIHRVLGEQMVKKLSPWGIVNYRQIAVKGKQLDTYELYGIQQLDYYDLFQKFGYSYGAQESYKLDHIAWVVLGENKLSYEEFGSLHSLYKMIIKSLLTTTLKTLS
jgi:DNA polymerase elongation subunit (family B)